MIFIDLNSFYYDLRALIQGLTHVKLREIMLYNVNQIPSFWIEKLKKLQNSSSSDDSDKLII